MDLDLTEEQIAIRDMTQSLLAEHATVDIVRQMEDDPKGYPEALWKQLGESGLIGMAIAESRGGGGLSLLDAALVYEEIGFAMAPVPHFVSAVVCAGLLDAAGNESQQAAWLPKIASGDAILTPAWLEPERGFGEDGVQTTAASDGDEVVLSGTKLHVAYAGSAERLLVLARGDAGVDLYLVDPTAAGVTLGHTLSQSGEPHFRVDLDGVRVPASDRIGAAGAGWRHFDAVMHRAIVLLAAQATGGAARCLADTVEYANTRVQFGKPLGAFQSLSHYLADAATKIDGGRVLVHEAAWNADRGRSISRLAPMAKLFCCDTYQQTTRSCIQIWGGVGFTREYDVQLHFRRAKELQLSWWDTRALEELVAADVLDH